MHHKYKFSFYRITHFEEMRQLIILRGGVVFLILSLLCCGIGIYCIYYFPYPQPNIQISEYFCYASSVSKR